MSTICTIKRERDDVTRQPCLFGNLIGIVAAIGRKLTAYVGGVKKVLEVDARGSAVERVCSICAPFAFSRT